MGVRLALGVSGSGSCSLVPPKSNLFCCGLGGASAEGVDGRSPALCRNPGDYIINYDNHRDFKFCWTLRSDSGLLNFHHTPQAGTAGVFLLARTSPLLEFAPNAT
jgi:hypothetical protein